MPDRRDIAQVVCHFGWGAEAARDLASRGCGLVAVVDVLSFSTTVDIATSRGIGIVPAPPGEASEVLARRPGARLASAERAGSSEVPWTLSPSRMLRAPVVSEVVLPSPNGSMISAAVLSAGAVAVASCLRCLSATAAFLAARARHASRSSSGIAVIAAGERWPDQSMRPAIEDLAGAAALLYRLQEAHGLALSREAGLAARSVAGLSDGDLADLVRHSMSAEELRERGDEEDVELACDLDCSGTTAVLTGAEGVYRAEAP